MEVIEMRRTRLSICILAAGSLLLSAAGMAPAQDECSGWSAVSTNLDLGYVSKYVWRGLVLNPDPAVQPSVTFAHPSGWSFNVWASMDTTDAGIGIGYGDKSGSFTEIDYTLNYAFSALGKSMNAGVVAYTFPHTNFDETSELFYNVGFGGMLSPSLSLNYDFDQVDGLYAALGVSHSVDMPLGENKTVPLSFAAKIGYATADYNDFYFGGNDKAAFTDAMISVSAPIAMGGFKLTPTLYYTMVVDSDLRDAVVDPDNFVIGLTGSYAF